MPEIDTGLGWAANSDWLLSLPATVANLQSFDDTNFPGQPAPEGSTQADFAAGGVTYGGGFYSWYLYMSGPEGPIFSFVYDRFTVVFCSPVERATLYTGFKDKETGRIGGTISHETCNSQNSGWWYWTTRQSSDFAAAVPAFGSIAQGIAALKAAMVNAPFDKTNSGYAVGCVAKWVTPNNVTIQTPILISSNTEYTDMETTLTGVYIAKLNILRQGVRFYMSFYDYTGTSSITPNNLPTLDLTETGPKTLEQVFAYIADLEHAAILVLDSPDPYQEESSASEEEGGDGEDVEDDPVEEETLPLPSVAGHGFCTIYVPSSQELNQMASYLWGGSFDVSQVIKLFSNPMDSILGLSAVPVDLVGSSEQIYLGGVPLTGVTMPKYTGRTSVKVDFGSVTVAKRWGSYLDYSPYTDFSIYLPFIGIKNIKADDIMGKTVNLTYAIDILSGGCVAYLRPAGESVLYEWSGQCALQIPVTGRSYDNVFQSAMSVATAAVAAVAAPASAPVLSGAVASAAVQAAATKPHIERSGTVNGITGFLGQLRPYLIRTIPEAYIPADQNKFIGYPAYINVDLASVVGYNEVDSIHLENVTATGAELEEIESVLKGGVIF